MELIGCVLDFITSRICCKSKVAVLYIISGEVQKDRAAEIFGMRPCAFRPKHSSKLGNEFCLFTNYDPEMRLGGWELEK